MSTMLYSNPTSPFTVFRAYHRVSDIRVLLEEQIQSGGTVCTWTQGSFGCSPCQAGIYTSMYHRLLGAHSYGKCLHFSKEFHKLNARTCAFNKWILWITITKRPTSQGFQAVYSPSGADFLAKASFSLSSRTLLVFPIQLVGRIVK